MRRQWRLRRRDSRGDQLGPHEDRDDKENDRHQGERARAYYSGQGGCSFEGARARSVPRLLFLCLPNAPLLQGAEAGISAETRRKSLSQGFQHGRSKACCDLRAIAALQRPCKAKAHTCRYPGLICVGTRVEAGGGRNFRS